MDFADAMHSKRTSTPALLAALTLLAACPDGKETTTEGETASTTGGPGTTGDASAAETADTDAISTTSSTTGPTSGATTEPEPTSGGETTAGETTALTTSDGDTSGGDTSGGETTGGSAVEASCMAACAALVGCGLFPEPTMCQQACVDGSTGSPECEAASVAFNECISGQRCDQLMDPAGACPEELAAVDMACE